MEERWGGGPGSPWLFVVVHWPLAHTHTDTHAQTQLNRVSPDELQDRDRETGDRDRRDDACARVARHRHCARLHRQGRGGVKQGGGRVGRVGGRAGLGGVWVLGGAGWA